MLVAARCAHLFGMRGEDAIRTGVELARLDESELWAQYQTFGSVLSLFTQCSVWVFRADNTGTLFKRSSTELNFRRGGWGESQCKMHTRMHLVFLLKVSRAGSSVSGFHSHFYRDRYSMNLSRSFLSSAHRHSCFCLLLPSIGAITVHISVKMQLLMGLNVWMYVWVRDS